MLQREHSFVWSSYEIVERIMELEGQKKKKDLFFYLSIPTYHLNDLEQVSKYDNSLSS